MGSYKCYFTISFFAPLMPLVQRSWVNTAQWWTGQLHPLLFWLFLLPTLPFGCRLNPYWSMPCENLRCWTLQYLEKPEDLALETHSLSASACRIHEIFLNQCRKAFCIAAIVGQFRIQAIVSFHFM